MITLMLLGALAVAPTLPQRGDTTFAVREGASLSIHNDRGSVEVRTWGQDRVRVTADYDDNRGGYTLRDRGTRLDLRATSRRGPVEIDMRVTVPEWMAVEVEGTFADITIEGTMADVSAHTTHGDISVTGGRGFVQLNAVNGDITLEGSSGRARIETMNGDIYVTRASGELDVETINGEVDLIRVDAIGADISTVNGDITYTGSLAATGVYSFTTHNGDVDLELDSDVNAEVSISTVQGDFETDCPVRLSQTRSGGRQFDFQVGTGGAHINLESFGGTVRLGTRGACWSGGR